jgi:hypothetical protein
MIYKKNIVSEQSLQKPDASTIFGLSDGQKYNLPDNRNI